MLDEVHFSRTLQNFHVFGISKTHEYKFFLCYTLHTDFFSFFGENPNIDANVDLKKKI